MAGKNGAEAGTPEKIGGRWYYSGGNLQRPSVEWFDVDVRDWENVQGWYRPESFPDVAYLTLRITADGEVLPPYFKPTVVHGEDVSRETSVPTLGDAAPSCDAERGSGGDHPEDEKPAALPGVSPVPASASGGVWCASCLSSSGGHDRHGPSTGLPDAPASVMPSRPVSPVSGKDERHLVDPLCRTRNFAVFSHLTKSGLSSGQPPPVSQPLSGCPLKNDPEILCRRSVYL